MKLLIILASSILLAHARPQEFLSDDEVELIPPRSTGTERVEGAEDEGPVVFIIKGGFPGFPGGFPRIPGMLPRIPDIPRLPSIFGSGGFGGLGGLEDLGGIFRDPPVVDFEDVFAPPQEETQERECGPICQIFKVFTEVGPRVPSILQGGNQSLFDGEFDLNNSTYEEKVLEDGTIVRINKTTVSDSDGSGNQFFFHSSVFHNIGDDAETDESTSNTDTEVPAEEDIKDPLDIDILPESDPSFNEIDDLAISEEFPTANVQIDDGLLE